jgi:hypothetical protein
MSILRSTSRALIDQRRCRRNRNLSCPRTKHSAPPLPARPWSRLTASTVSIGAASTPTSAQLAWWTGETLGQAEERHEK